MNENEFYESFNTLLSLQQNTEALCLIDTYLSHEQNQNVLYEKAYLLSEMDRVEESIEAYTALLQIDKTHTWAWNDIAILYFDQNNVNKAIECIQHAITYDNKEVMFQKNLGMFYSQVKNYTEAIKALRKASTLDSENIEIWEILSNVYINDGKNEEALECLDTCIRLNPNEESFHRKKGYTLKLLRRYEESVLHFEQAIFLNDTIAESWFEKGSVHAELDELKNAKDCFEVYTRLESHDPHGLYNLGIVVQRMKLHSYAISCYDQVLQLDATHPQTWHQRANACAAVQRWSDAFFSFGKAHELDPTNCTILMDHACALFLFQSYDQTIEILGALLFSFFGRPFVIPHI